MSIENISPDVVGKYWMEQEKKGIVAIEPIAQAISEKFGSFDVKRVASTIQRTPTENHIYPGTKEAMTDLLSLGDRLVIWTQGDAQLQAWKLATSGLSSLRKGKNSHNRKNFIFFSSEDKIPSIPHIISKYSNDQQRSTYLHKAVIVDDKANNIYAAQQLVQDARTLRELPDESEFPINFVWMRHELGRSKDILPEDISMDTFLQTCHVASSPESLLQIRKELTKDRNLLWLLDVDHTILHTSGWRNNHFETITQEINQ